MPGHMSLILVMAFPLPLRCQHPMAPWHCQCAVAEQVEKFKYPGTTLSAIRDMQALFQDLEQKIDEDSSCCMGTP